MLKHFYLAISTNGFVQTEERGREERRREEGEKEMCGERREGGGEGESKRGREGGKERKRETEINSQNL